MLTLLQGLGALPIVAWLESQPDTDHSLNTFLSLDQSIGAGVGQALLARWDYKQSWINDVGQRDQWLKPSDGGLGRADLCLLASWAEQDIHGRELPSLDQVPAFHKWQAANLPIQDGIGDMLTDNNQIRLAAIQELLA